MQPIHRYTAFRALAAIACLASAPAALADDRECDGTIGDERVDANVIVREACTLDGTIVNGNVRIESGARARIFGGARIDGNVQSQGASVVIVQDARIDGDVQLEDVADEIRVEASEITGTVQLKANDGNARIGGNEIDGDVQAFGNRGALRIAVNSIGGNLQCKENRYVPEGRSNRVAGSREDQCRQL